MGEGRLIEPMRLFSDVSARITDPWLRRAFCLAENGRGTTSPNPLVGCVLVRDGEVVGEGYHGRAGGPHAEVVALHDAGEAARGAAAYVTLEPCNHQGRTPPCTHALHDAGVARVVVGMGDPNPRVDGGGAAALRELGVEVDFADDPGAFLVQNEAWCTYTVKGRPFVRVKEALSLDGRLALESGRRAAVTGPSGAQVTQRLRARADAVLVGSATASVDDPSLTVRDASHAPTPRQPLRVVLAGDTLPSATSRVFTDGHARTLVLAPASLARVARSTLPDPVEVAEYDLAAGLAAALAALGSLGVVDLLVEAGPRLFTELWREGLADEFIAVHAGGMAGPQAPALYLGEPDVSEFAPDALDHVMAPLETGIVGDVAVTVWRPSHDGTKPAAIVFSNSPSTKPGR
jgi:diaminohydroxyphosphoribosylaminopyrimidine deaminase/5-amino-6-(5-phosphoribosylamino)uracil reductase